MDLVGFRKKLTFVLINNKYLGEGEYEDIKKKRKLQVEHSLVRALPYCGKFIGGMWGKLQATISKLPLQDPKM